MPGIDKEIQSDADGDRLRFTLSYLDAADLIHDYQEALSTGRIELPTEATESPGADVTLTCTFPGLCEPLVLAASIEEVVSRKKPTGPGLVIALADAARDSLAAWLPRIEAGDPELMVRAVRVLLVEDNVHAAKLIEDGLHLASRRAFQGRIAFHVPMATNTADAMAFLGKNKPIDALITDVYLSGGVGGTELIEHVRADPTLDEIPVIAISGGHDEDTRQAVLDAGATVFLQKPLSLRVLVAAISESLDLSDRDGTAAD